MMAPAKPPPRQQPGKARNKALAFRSLKSLKHDDDDLYEMSRGMPDDYEPPEYPTGCCFTLTKEALAEIGGDGGEPGQTIQFSAICEVTSVFRSVKDSRVELKVTELAGPDGQYFNTDNTDNPWLAPCICLRGAELEKIGLEADAEQGDLLHIFGSARLESLSSNEFSGEQASLQITDLDFEDESEEAREHLG